MMVRDFGAGLTVDELIGMPACHILNLELPPGETFRIASRAAGVMVAVDLDSYLLAELWEDGHTVWHNINQNKPVVVTPTGQLIRTRS